MQRDIRRARIVGVLFIFATVAAMISTTISDQIFMRADFLQTIGQSKVPLTIAVGLFYLMEASVVAIAILLYPVLKPFGQAMAIGYIAARAAEGFFGIVSRTAMLTLIFLGERFLSADAAQQLGIAASAEAISNFAEVLFTVASVFFFGVSALILNQLLFQARLVPAFISIWGWIGGALLLVAVVVNVFGVSFPAMEAVLILPIAVNEMVLAGWLIVKGFNPPVQSTTG